jgi:hypothetical protein
MNEQLLKDFIATAQKYNYDWNKTFGLFPELKGYDQQVLKDYVATAEKYSYDYSKVNSLFPEFGFAAPQEELKKKEQPQPQPTQEPQQAQGAAQAAQAKPDTALPSGASSSALPSAETPEERGLTLLTPEFGKKVAEQEKTGVGFGSQAAPQYGKMLEGVPALPKKEPKPKTKDETPKETPYFTGTFGALLQAMDSNPMNPASVLGIGDFIDDMGRSLDAGEKQGALVTPANQLMVMGPQASPAMIRKYMNAAEKMENVPPSQEMIDFQKIYEEEGGGIWGFVKGVAFNPTVLPQILVSSLRAMANPTSAAAGGTVVGGAAAGGAAFGGVGAGATALASIPYAMAAAGTTLETGLSFSEFLNDKLKERGLEFTEENVKSILEDEKALSDIRTRSVARGATIGVVDAFTGRLAGKVGAKLATGTAASKVKAGLAGSAIEAVGGSTGEAAGRAVAGQEMDTAEILFEGVSEAPMAVIDIAAEVMQKPLYKINGEMRSANDVQEIIDNASAEDLQKINFDFKNDRNGFAEKIQDKITTNEIRNEIAQVNPNLDEESVNELVSLEKELRNYEGKKTQSAKDKASEIRSRIREVQQGKPAEAAPAEATPAPIEVTVERIESLPTDVKVNTEFTQEDGTVSPVMGNEKVLFDLYNKSVETPAEQRSEQQNNIISLTEKLTQDAIQKQTAGQVPVQPTARVGEEVEEGAPQAEPQVPAQKGLQDQEIELTQQINELEASLADETQQDITFGETTLPRAEAEAKLEQLTTEREAVQFEASLQEEVSSRTPEQTRAAEEDMAISKLKENVKNAKRNISSADDTQAAIEEYNAALKELQDFEASVNERKQKEKSAKNIDSLIEDERTQYEEDSRYEYKELYDKDPRLAAIQRLKDMIEFAKSGDLERYYIEQGNSAERAKKDVERAIQRDEKDLAELEADIKQRPTIPSKDKAQFMLESQQSQAKQDMIDEATRLMEQEEKNGFSEKAFDATNPEPTVKPIAIEIKENTRLADKVKRMGLKELIGKKINLVMADQLKVGDISIGRRILKRMGGPFFPLIDELFGKVAWASINKSAASSIVNGAIKSDYTVVYNMNPSAIDSNSAMRDTFIAMVRKMPKVERDAIISKIVNQIKGKKFGSKTEQVQNDIVKVKTLSDFEKMMSALDVDTKALIINMILPSKDVKAETEIGSALQEKGITIESIREINIEQFVADLPSGALTMVIEVQDKNGNKITEATKEEAIITPEQQKEEGLPSHDNYPIYIRGKAVAILSETVPFWNILKDSLNTINVKVAKIVKQKSGRAFTAKEARSAEMRSASMSANAVRKVSNIAATEYEKFVSLLSRAFPTVEVVANQKEFDKLINELGAKKLVTKDQNIYGAVYNGKVYLNPSLENYNTPIHEFGHIWLNVAKNVNPELYKKGLSLVSDSPYVQQIKDNKDYQRVIKNMMKEGASESEIDTYIREEALATAIGDRGESFVIAAQKKNFKEWLNKLYSVVRKLVGISKYTAEQLETITFDEFTKAVAVDLMSGNEIFTKLQVKEFSKQLQLSTGKKDPEAIVKQGRANGVSENAIRSVLSRRGFTAEQIDAAMAKPEAGKKIELSEELMQGYDKMMADIDAVIESGLNRKAKQETILNNVLKKVRESEAYKNGTDIQKEEIEREVKKAFGEKMKSAPKVETLLGGINSVDKITIAVRDLVANQIKSLARGAKDAKKAWMKASDLMSKDLKDMVASKKISAKQAAAVIKRFAKVDMFNETSVENFVNYMAKVFADAEYAEKIAGIKSKLKTAKKNIYTKLGISKNLVPLLDSMLAINPTLVPDSVFDTYVELVDMLSKREAVLSLQEVNAVTEKTEKILDAINKQESVAAQAYQQYLAYDKKVIKDNEVDFAATVKKMVEDNSITEAEAEILRKYKNRLMERDGKKKTEEEIAQERTQMLDSLDNTSVTPDALPSRIERDAAAELIELAKSDAVKGLDNIELNNLLKALDNIANGYFPHQAQLLIERLNAINRSKPLADAEIKAKPLAITKVYASLKSLITRNKTAIEEMIRRSPLKFIDQVFGDFKTNAIFKSLFEPISSAYGQFASNLKRVENRLDDAYNNILKSHKGNPLKTLMSSYKITAYMIQNEFDSNKGSKQVNKASDFLKATIKQIYAGESHLSEKNAQMLQEVLDWVNTFTDADGNVDTEAMLQSMSKAERDAIGVVRDINDSLTEKAMFTASVIRGEKIKPLNNYIHLQVMKNNYNPEDNTVNESDSMMFSDARKPSSKAKNLVERTGDVSPINFDIFSSAQRGARFVLLDYHMTPAIRTARKTLAETKKSLENEDGIIQDKKTRQVNSAINNVFEEVLKNTLSNTFTVNSFAEEVVDYISKTGYRAVLAGVPRFASELTSNVGFAAIIDPEAFSQGFKLRGVSMSAVGADVMLNLGSGQVTRIYSNDPLTGRLIDTQIMSQSGGKRMGKANRDVANKLQQIYNNTLGKYKNSVEFVADALISTPDKIVMRSMWFGSFAKEFKKITGVEPDFDKIAANDEAYMNEYKDALKESTSLADNKTILTAATDNPFMGILKGAPTPTQSSFVKAFNIFNNYMTRFLIYEYMTARQGIMAAMGNGYLTKKQGAAMLGAVMTRMTVYTFLMSILTQAMVGLFVDDEDEDDDKSLLQKFGQSLTSAVTGLMLGRDFGNATKSIINYGIELGNQEFLDFLREGEYDPYKDAIAFTPIPVEPIKKDGEEKKGGPPSKKGLYDFIIGMTGPYAPTLKTADLIIKKAFEEPKKTPEAIERQRNVKQIRIPLEVLGNLGLIPLYKDVRKVTMAAIYKDMDKASKKSEAEKAQEELDKPPYDLTMEEYKRYFPKDYEKRYGENSEYRKRKKYKNRLKDAKADMKREMLDDFYNYQPKKKKGFGSEGFGDEGFGDEKFGGDKKSGFGSEKFGED